MSFHFYCEEFEEISQASIERLEGALDGFVASDVPLAIELILSTARRYGG